MSDVSKAIGSWSDVGNITVETLTPVGNHDGLGDSVERVVFQEFLLRFRNTRAGVGRFSVLRGPIDCRLMATARRSGSHQSTRERVLFGFNLTMYGGTLMTWREEFGSRSTAINWRSFGYYSKSGKLPWICSMFCGTDRWFHVTTPLRTRPIRYINFYRTCPRGERGFPRVDGKPWGIWYRNYCDDESCCRFWNTCEQNQNGPSRYLHTITCDLKSWSNNIILTAMTEWSFLSSVFHPKWFGFELFHQKMRGGT